MCTYTHTWTKKKKWFYLSERVTCNDDFFFHIKLPGFIWVMNTRVWIMAAGLIMLKILTDKLHWRCVCVAMRKKRIISHYSFGITLTTNNQLHFSGKINWPSTLDEPHSFVSCSVSWPWSFATFATWEMASFSRHFENDLLPNWTHLPSSWICLIFNSIRAAENWRAKSIHAPELQLVQGEYSHRAICFFFST